MIVQVFIIRDCMEDFKLIIGIIILIGKGNKVDIQFNIYFKLKFSYNVVMIFYFFEREEQLRLIFQVGGIIKGVDFSCWIFFFVFYVVIFRIYVFLIEKQ